MAVVTPDGIVGKVVDAYPTTSLVMLVTDPTFAAGVISQKNRVRGTLKGLGQTKCLVDYVQNEERVDQGEWFYTSGDDRIFPRGFPVGQVASVRNGKTFKEIFIAPSGIPGGVEEVLIMLQGEHMQVPDGEMASPGYKILNAPPESVAEAPQPTGQPTVLTTDADRLREQYKQAGEAQHHVFGEGAPGSTPPDFTKIPGIRASAPLPNPPAAGSKPQPATGTPPPQSSATATAGQQQVPSGATAKATTERTASAASPTPQQKPKPAPTGPILVTDPTDADPGADAAPAPAAKPAKPAPTQKPSGNPPPANR
jgi:rod shape-determining protein MreC